MTPSNRGAHPKSGARRPGQSSRKLPAKVYRRRRFVLLIGAVLVLALGVLGITGIVRAINGGDDARAGTSQRTETAAPTQTAPVPDAKAASGMCPDKEVTISAKADKKSYKEDEEPRFGLVIDNRHSATCLIQVGTKEQEFLVEKDGKTVWSSAYCAAPKDENSEVSTEFAPASSKTANFEWNRIQVDKNCNRTNRAFGPGSYDLVVKLGDKQSEPATFELEKSAAQKAKEKEAAEKKAAKEKKAKEKATSSPSPAATTTP